MAAQQQAAALAEHTEALRQHELGEQYREAYRIARDQAIRESERAGQVWDAPSEIAFHTEFDMQVARQRAAAEAEALRQQQAAALRAATALEAQRSAEATTRRNELAAVVAVASDQRKRLSGTHLIAWIVGAGALSISMLVGTFTIGTPHPGGIGVPTALLVLPVFLATLLLSRAELYPRAPERLFGHVHGEVLEHTAWVFGPALAGCALAILVAVFAAHGLAVVLVATVAAGVLCGRAWAVAVCRTRLGAVRMSALNALIR
jgi:hypothetical protein